jgi:hypothetical protein
LADPLNEVIDHLRSALLEPVELPS